MNGVRVNGRFVLLLAAFAISCGLAQNGNDAPIVLKFGFPRNAIPDLNERDAKAVVKLWSDDYIDEQKYKPVFNFYTDELSLVQSLTDGQIDIAPLSPIQYVQFDSKRKLYPAVCAKIRESVYDRFVLLVRKDSRFTGLGDLLNRTLLIRQESPQSALNTWLQVLMHEAGLPRPELFFREMIKKERESQLVFPLLLKQADCCIMTQGAFHTMSELNPQLDAQLTQLMTSDSLLISSILVYTDRLDEAVRNDLTSLALNWTAGKTTDQLQILFGFNTLIPYEDQYVETIRLLLERHARIQLTDNPVPR
ncbi:MAG TPA: hypothetical protein ENN03_05915 [bacterium]|nr:hypothetical protein [bacterium]